MVILTVANEKPRPHQWLMVRNSGAKQGSECNFLRRGVGANRKRSAPTHVLGGNRNCSGGNDRASTQGKQGSDTVLRPSRFLHGRSHICDDHDDPRMDLGALDQRYEVIPIVGNESETFTYDPAEDLRVRLARPASMRHMIRLEAPSVCDLHEFR